MTTVRRLQHSAFIFGDCIEVSTGADGIWRSAISILAILTGCYVPVPAFGLSGPKARGHGAVAYKAHQRRHRKELNGKRFIEPKDAAAQVQLITRRCTLARNLTSGNISSASELARSLQQRCIARGTWWMDLPSAIFKREGADDSTSLNNRHYEIASNQGQSRILYGLK